MAKGELGRYPFGGEKGGTWHLAGRYLKLKQILSTFCAPRTRIRNKGRSVGDCYMGGDRRGEGREKGRG